VKLGASFLMLDAPNLKLVAPSFNLAAGRLVPHPCFLGKLVAPSFNPAAGGFNIFAHFLTLGTAGFN
jgi:hypothetical protein